MAYEIQWMTMGGGGAGLAIDSTTTNYTNATGTTVTTVTSIPSGAVVVVLITGDPQGGVAAVTVTSPNLTFTQQTDSGTLSTNWRSAIFTAVSGSLLSSEAVTGNIQTFGRHCSVSVVVLTGANTSALTNASSTGLGASSGTYSTSISAVGGSSYALAASFTASSNRTSTPDANSTELVENVDGARLNTSMVNRNTTAGGGTITVGGTWSGNAQAVQSIIEIQAA